MYEPCNREMLHRSKVIFYLSVSKPKDIVVFISLKIILMSGKVLEVEEIHLVLLTKRSFKSGNTLLK